MMLALSDMRREYWLQSLPNCTTRCPGGGRGRVAQRAKKCRLLVDQIHRGTPGPQRPETASADRDGRLPGQFRDRMAGKLRVLVVRQHSVVMAEIWLGRGVSGYLGALGRYLAGTGRQFGADLNGEVQVRLAAGHLFQALGDERGGPGNVTTALGDPRAQRRTNPANCTDRSAGPPPDHWLTADLRDCRPVDHGRARGPW
jgi:hypothetical protein